MILRKAIWMFFALFIGFASIGVQEVQAAEGYFSVDADREGSDCGVSGGDMVAAKSFSICKEDLAYNVIYMAFSKVFNEYDILKAFVFEDAASLDSEGYAANMGGAILAIILGVTQVVFIAGAIILGLTTVKVIYNSMTSGQFLGQGVNRVWLILRSLLVIFLIFPIGTISLSQLGVLMVALFALMGGNFFYGLFLSTIQKEALLSEDTPSTESQAAAISQADALMSASLCQTRTIQAIRQQKFKHYKENTFSWIDKLDFDKQIGRISNCIAPQVYYSYPLTTLGANTIKAGSVESLSIGKVTTCEGVGDSTFLSEYDPEYHGASFNCGTLAFSNPKLSDEVSTSKGNDDANAWFSTTVPAIDTYIESGYTKYNLQSKLQSYFSRASGTTQNGTFDYSSLDSDVKSFADSLKSSGLTLYETVKQDTDHNTAVKALFVANAILFNNLLGGKSPSSESVVGASDVVGGVPALAYTGTKEVIKMLQDRYAMKQNDSFRFLEKYSVDGSSLIDMAHCVKNFSKVADGTSQTVKAINNAPDNFEDFVKQADSIYAGECVWFTSTAEQGTTNLRFSSSAVGASTGFGGNGLITLGSLGSIISDKKAWGSADTANKINQLQIDYLLKAQANKLALASHFYVVREAVKNSMLEILAEATDKELPKKMRKQGFASFGGFILQISSDQTNINKYIKRINSGVTWSAYSDGSSGMYVNEDAYSNVDMSVAENKVQFLVMELNDFFGAGTNNSRVAVSGVTGGSSEDDSSILQEFARYIEDSLTAPMVYLKKMGGTDLNLPLREGVEKCFKEGNCYPGDVHPVNALSYMGIDLMDSAINFYLIKIAVNVLNSILNADSGDSGSISNGAFGKVAGLLTKFPLVKAGAMILKFLSGLLNFLAPLFAVLFLAGVFFGYMVPMMPYVAFLVMFLGWIVYIFQLLITVPIWLVMIAIPGPTGEPRGNIGMLWQYTGLLLLKPSLMVIGMIFGWYFAVLSIFFINMTFFGVMGTVFSSHGGSIIFPLIDLIMFYLIYMVIVFVALKHSFSIISSFPDTVSSALELKGYGDSRTIQDVGAEKLLGLMIVNQVKTAVTSSIRELGVVVKEHTGRGEKQKLREQQIHAARQAATNKVEEVFDDINKKEERYQRPVDDEKNGLKDSMKDKPKGE